MRPACRGTSVIALLFCLASCSPSASPPPTPKSVDYAAEQAGDFARWQAAVRMGTQRPNTIWECALCPKLSLLPAGGVWTGTPDWDEARDDNEPPLAEVKFPEPFAFGTYEVTRGEYDAFARATGRALPADCLADGKPGANYRDVGFTQADDHPVACVGFEDAREYVAWLNTQTSGGYRLLTEAEWEYAARSHQFLTYTWGDDAALACHYANVLDESAGKAPQGTEAVSCRDGARQTSPVGSYAPVAFLGYDMTGNVAEWVDGCADAELPPGTACARRIVKGGSWASPSARLRPAARTFVPGGQRDNRIGIRVAKSLADMRDEPRTAEALLRRSQVFMMVADYRSALLDLDRAIELERSAAALASRGWLHFWRGRTDAAREDVDAALALDPEWLPAMAGHAALAIEAKKHEDALAGFDKALAVAPGYVIALSQRAYAGEVAGRFEQAAADAEAVIRDWPVHLDMWELRSRALMRLGDWPRALRSVDELVVALPTLERAQVFAASSYARMLHDDEAMKAANWAVRLTKSDRTYLARYSIRSWDDLEGRREDVTAALEAEPGSQRALEARAEVESREGEHQQAANTLSELLRQEVPPGIRPRLLTARGIEYLNLGENSLATKDFEDAIGDPPSARSLNNLCWELAIAELSLQRALSYCNRAIALAPGSAAYHDSKGMVLLRMARWEDAIKAYDAALRIDPRQSSSLYGRGIARQARCNCEGGTPDLKKALQYAPAAAREYDRAGIGPLFPAAVKPPERSPATASS